MYMSKVIAPPIDEYKSRPRPANLPFWIMCFLHHHRDRNVPRNEIIEAALLRHYSRDQIFEAFDYIRGDLYTAHIGNWWESQDRVEYLRWYEMTEEEANARIADRIWFEALPDHRKTVTV